jgi:hypothetical protein
VAKKKDNCPDPHGDDFDFGAPPVLQSLGGGLDILLLSQKSGVVYAVDPGHRGRLLWQSRIGRGGALGGIEWGIAADKRYGDFRQLCGPLSFLRLPNKLKQGTYPVQRQEIQEPSLSEV